MSASPTGYIAYNPDDNPLMAKASSETNSNHLAQSSDSDTQIKKELIADYKAIIAAEPGTKSAEEALWRYYSLVRTDRENKLAERSVVLGYLNEVYNANSSVESGKIALQLLILEQRRLQNLQEAIALSQVALKDLSGEARAGVLFNLVFTELTSGDLKTASALVEQFKTDYPKKAAESEFLANSVQQAAEEQTGAVSLSKTQVNHESTALNGASQSREASVLEISPNYPNPFNPETRIRYRLAKPAFVQLKIFNLTGQEVRTLESEQKSAGDHLILWDGRDNRLRPVSSGVYIYTITVRSETGQRLEKSRKLVLVR